MGRRGFNVAVLGVAMGVAGPLVPEARSQCVEAAVYVTRQGAPPVWVYGEHDRCVAPTPWGETVTYHGELTRTGLPEGSPNGYWIDLRVPAP